ncbi:MAG: hypothetical protein NXI20_19060 [bacterium]|nr:hypothetical protein [bacterium]
MNLKNDFLSGSWKGELVVENPGQDLIKTSVDFYMKIKFNWSSKLCSGIYMANPDDSGILDHSKVYGEIAEDDQIKFLLKYPKFYWQPMQGEEVLSIEDRVHPNISLQGSVQQKNRLFGKWSMPEDYIELNGDVIKTGDLNGIWWAERV